MYHLRDRKCEKDLFDNFSGRGLNTGISGLNAPGNLALANWIFEDTDMAPSVVYLAIGINDCRRGGKGKDVASAIIETIKVIKYFSPGTAVKWQKILPAADDEDDWEDAKWKDQDAYDCVEEANEKVEDWIDDNDSHTCIEVVDLEDFVLKGGKIRDVYGDGLHFTDGGDLEGYCKEITKEIEDFRKNDVEARSSGLEPWMDVEPLHFEPEGEAYFRWNYSEWSTCSGACGSQRRTVGCLRFEPNATVATSVESELCRDIFLNPLERICDMTTECVARLPGPPEALVHQPGTFVMSIPKDTLMTIAMNQPGQAAQDECSSTSPILVGLSAACIVLAALLVASAGVAVYQSRKLRETARQPETTAAAIEPSTEKAVSV